MGFIERILGSFAFKLAAGAVILAVIGYFGWRYEAGMRAIERVKHLERTISLKDEEIRRAGRVSAEQRTLAIEAQRAAEASKKAFDEMVERDIAREREDAKKGAPQCPSLSRSDAADLRRL